MRLLGIILFFAALCVPSLLSLTGWLDEYAIDENRTRAAPPRFGFLNNPVGYCADWEKWFDDRFGGRDFLIRLKTQIDYSVFATSSRVHIGKDGWLFYRSVLDTEKPSMERLLADDGGAVDKGLADLARALKARNVRLILMPIFLGDVFYADKVPKSTPRLPQPSQFALAVERWRNIQDVTVFDSAPVLRGIQTTRQTFHKTDFHWNEPAAFDVAHALVDRVAQLQGIQRPIWDHRLEIETRPYSGKEATFLPLFSMPGEDGLFVKQNWSEPDLSYAENQGPYEWVSTQRAPDRGVLPAVCAIGDSFFDALSFSGFAAYFKTIYFVRWRSETSLYTALEQMPADCRYVLVEFMEVQFPAVRSFVSAADHVKVLKAAP